MIRKANENDYPKLCEMAKRDKFTRDFPAISYRWGWEGKVFLIEEEEIAGFYYANICKRINRSTLYEIYIDNKFRGKGLGKKLFEHYRSKAIDAGKTKLKWIVNKKNSDALLFYKSMGFNYKTQSKENFIYEEAIH